MDKDEVLKRSVEENKHQDECEKMSELKSYKKANFVILVLFVVINVIELLRDEYRLNNGMFALLWGYLASLSISSFLHHKKRMYAFQMIAYILAAIVYFIMFLKEG